MDDKLACNKLNCYYQQNASRFSMPPQYEIQTLKVNGFNQFVAVCRFSDHEETGQASSKQEAKKIAASNMLRYLDNKPPTPSISISEEIKNPQMFNQEEVLDVYLQGRVKSLSKFEELFLKDLMTDLPFHFKDVNVGFKSADSPKSVTLNNLPTQYDTITSTNFPELFETIVKELGFEYYAEFMESKNKEYLLIIKINFNLITMIGHGLTPEQAILDVCKKTITYLRILNL